ncbi:MAG: hypothetical protein HZC55_03910 [Verrucomicrobia bacterium]|nr:hypothetical protein [Verrucomicrobiota bacterium]
MIRGTRKPASFGEEVRHRECDPGRDGRLQFAQRHEDVAVRIRMVQLELIEEMAAGPDLEVRVLLRLAEIPRAFRLDIAHGPQGVPVETGGDERLLERLAQRRRLHIPHAPRPGGEQGRRQRHHGGGMRHVALSHRPAKQRLEIAPGEVDLHRHGLVLHQPADAAEQVEAPVERRPHLWTVAAATHDRHPGIATGRRLFGRPHRRPQGRAEDRTGAGLEKFTSVAGVGMGAHGRWIWRIFTIPATLNLNATPLRARRPAGGPWSGGPSWAPG